MSKRYIFQQQFGKRKKAKLDVTVSDHNFPQSQNADTFKDTEPNNIWGDEVDDEMLLLASQACEEAISSHNVSELPNYSVCMDPPSTSTQIQQPIPSTSKSGFQFKVPSSNIVLATLTSKLTDKCERISSPLPGISKVCKSDNINISDDLIFNNEICKGQDSDHIYRQLLQLKEENEKLKSENGKLLEKCVTKEGEASILRTQLKTCQIAVDNARMDKIKAQEKDQMLWSEKLSVANKQLSDLRTQLDFKNLEIISTKEKCKMLESNKVKLSQVRMTGNNAYMSQNHNNNSYNVNATHLRRIKTTSNAVQTENRSHFMKLGIGFTAEYTKLTEILPIIMDPTYEQSSILECNEKLKQYESSNKCRIYTTFHKLPSSNTKKKQSRYKYNLSCLYEDLSYICTNKECDVKKCLHIVNIAKHILQDIQYELEEIQQRITTAFTKEMDEIYMEMTRNMVDVSPQDLLSGKALYKAEQGILARRITAVLVYILEDVRYRNVHESLLEDKLTMKAVFVDIINRICDLMDKTTTAVLYSGLLLSVTLLCKTFVTDSNIHILRIMKNLILSRPMGFVSCKILQLLEMFSKQHVLQEMCCQGTAGNLKVDHEQGVLLYKRDSCVLQILLKQVEAALKCIEKQYLMSQAVDSVRSILKFYSKLNGYVQEQADKSKCECQSVLLQVMVYSLKICADMWTYKERVVDMRAKKDLHAVCQSGVQVLYYIVSTESDTLVHCEGHLLHLCELIRTNCDELHCNMISEIINIYQAATEESPQSYNKQAWIKSFQTFSIVE